MTPQKQLHRHRPDLGEYGDCLRTCIACLLDLSPEDVPHLHTPDDVEAATVLDRWLASGGRERLEHRPAMSPERFAPLQLVRVPFGGDQPMQAVLDNFGGLNPGLRYMLVGTSRNGVAHVVICRDDAVVWDTSLDDSGIVGPIGGLYWVLVLARKL